MKEKNGKKGVCILLVLVQAALYGLGTPLTKQAYASVSPLWCLALRFMLAAAVMACVGGRRMFAELCAVRAGAWLPAAACMCGAYVCFNVGLDSASATVSGFLTSLSVVFTPLLARLVHGGRYDRRMIAVQLAALAGLYLLCGGGGSFCFGWGEALALASALFVAGSLVFGEKGLRELSAAAVSFTQLAFTAVACLAMALCADGAPRLGQITLSAWLAIVYLALPSGCLCYWLQNAALRTVPSGVVALAQCAEPVFTALFSRLLLCESMGAAGYAGSALLLASILAGSWVNLRGGAADARAG